MNNKLLRETGEALYGPRWQSEIGRDLNVSDRTIRRWLAGADDVPAGVALDLLRLCDEKSQAIDDVRDRLRSTATP